MKNLAVFIAVILLIPGCSYYDIVKKDKVEYLEGPKEKISKVVFNSGEFIQFDEDGGNYYNMNNCIAGMTLEKGFTIIPINKINKVESNWGNLAIGEDLSADTAYISKVLLIDGKSITFRKRSGGGRYYKDNKIIIAGIDTSLKHYQIEIDKISYFDIYKLDSTKSFLVNLGVAGIVVAIVYFLGKASFSISNGPIL